MKIGILGTSDIAFRRFLPALKSYEKFEYAGVASRDIKKTTRFISEFGGKGYDGYEALLNDNSIDAVYIPLPPALHYHYGNLAIEKNKHVLMEKPFTISLCHTKALIEKAINAKVALQENYMFQYHSQIEKITEIINGDKLGEIRLIRASFGFPMRQQDDFRYNKELGGGAVFDAGGYVVKLASLLLGSSAVVKSSSVNISSKFNVDINGCVTIQNDDGLIFQGAFGMDNSYQCSLEIWGSKGRLFTNRIFTAPPDINPTLTLELIGTNETITLDSDDHFKKSIDVFYKAINNKIIKEKCYNDIMLQSKLVFDIFDILK